MPSHSRPKLDTTGCFDWVHSVACCVTGSWRGIIIEIELNISRSDNGAELARRLLAARQTNGIALFEPVLLQREILGVKVLKRGQSGQGLDAAAGLVTEKAPHSGLWWLRD